MCKGLIGKKLGMTGVFASDGGKHIPVTMIQLGPCVVTQIKLPATDGYSALQIGFSEKKANRTNKPLKGHFKKSGEKCFAFLGEFPADNPAEYTTGQTLTPAEIFKIGEKVNVSGIIKGRGFAGVVKRHGFSGGKETHGCKSRRVPGSIGSSAWPSRVVKGKRLPGHYGNTRQTVRNMQIIYIRTEENIVFLKGAVPGAISGMVAVRKTK
jgi:large subunit ribosomal protein L3